MIAVLNARKLKTQFQLETNLKNLHNRQDIEYNEYRLLASMSEMVCISVIICRQRVPYFSDFNKTLLVSVMYK